MSQTPQWLWIVFAAVLAALLAIDFLSHRGEHAQSKKAALVWSAIWIGVGLAFGVVVLVAFGADHAVEYYAVYVIEKSLSVDNLFVFYVIFTTLSVPPERQRKALLVGIFGALVFRALFIYGGVAALDRWAFLDFVFGAILAWAAWRVFREDPRADEENRLVSWLSKHVRVTDEHHGGRLFARVDGKWVATPIVIAIVGLELSDIVFAMDSIPAAFAVTRRPFVIYAANAFAILGLRSLYLVLADSLERYRYVHYGLAFVLAFAGVKIAISRWVEIPAYLSVALIVLAIAASIVPTLIERRREREA
ncbi:MAG: TerC/Alx family metal homeostasis membrane protein [Sandaracinaceae bacterium]